jgi:hypothetical protein
MLRLLQHRRDLLFVTVVPADLRLLPGQLQTFAPRRLVERVKRQLGRRLQGITVVGGVDISYEVDGDGQLPNAWQPHLHMIVAGCSKEALEAILRHHYRKTDIVSRPVVIQTVMDAPKQFSYSCKPYFGRRVSYMTDGGERQSRRVRLKGPELRELALLTAQLKMSEMRVMIGVRQRGAELTLLSRKTQRGGKKGLESASGRLGERDF